jgi:hypothetical protein
MGRGPVNSRRVGGVCGTPYLPTRSAYSGSRETASRNTHETSLTVEISSAEARDFFSASAILDLEAGLEAQKKCPLGPFCLG